MKIKSDRIMAALIEGHVRIIVELIGKVESEEHVGRVRQYANDWYTHMLEKIERDYEDEPTLDDNLREAGRRIKAERDSKSKEGQDGR